MHIAVQYSPPPHHPPAHHPCPSSIASMKRHHRDCRGVLPHLMRTSALFCSLLLLSPLLLLLLKSITTTSNQLLILRLLPLWTPLQWVSRPSTYSLSTLHRRGLTLSFSHDRLLPLPPSSGEHASKLMTDASTDCLSLLPSVRLLPPWRRLIPSLRPSNSLQGPSTPIQVLSALRIGAGLSAFVAPAFLTNKLCELACCLTS